MIFRHAMRSLRRSPGFVAIAIVALGLGLGLTTTMFGLVEAVIHPYVPFRQPERLFSVLWFYNVRFQPLTPFQMYEAIRDQTRSFEVAAPVIAERGVMETGPNPGDVMVATIPPRLIPALGLEGILGRSLTESDGGSDAVMISDGLWHRAYAGRGDAIGSTLMIGGEALRVVGIMPRGMSFPLNSDAWRAMTPDAEAGGISSRWLRTFVRLKPGVSDSAAVQELSLLSQRLTAMNHQADAPYSIRLTPIAETRGRVREMQKAMVMAALAILLIACANLANLTLARGMAKRRELAVRMAVGASRSVLARGLFIEAALITLAGTAFGALVTWWCKAIIANRIPIQLQWTGLLEPRLSPRVFGWTAVAALAAAVLFGLLPSLRIARGIDLAEPLKEGGTTTARSHRRHSWMVIVELAFALPLMVAAGSLTKLVWLMASARSNYAATELLTGSVRMPGDSAVPGQDRRDLAVELIASLGAIDGVREVAAYASAAPAGNTISAELTSDSARLTNLRSYQVVSSNYLHTMGIAVVEGRDFEPGDATGGGAAIIDAAAAARLYPRGHAVGRMIRLGPPTSAAPMVRIVGVASTPTTDLRSLDQEPGPGIVWVARPFDPGRWVAFLVRAPHPDARLAARASRRLRELHPGAAIWIRSHLEDTQVELSLASFLAQLFVTMGTVALGLGAIGLYGVVAYTVSLRLREFAIRIALGAAQVDVRRLVLHDVFVMVLAGTGLGAVPAIGLAFPDPGSNVPDAKVLIVAEAVLIVTMIAACLAPARRAVRANPLDIMRAV